MAIRAASWPLRSSKCGEELYYTIQNEAKRSRARRLGGAVLDVFDTEPLPARHPLWRPANVAITPHISGPSVAAEIAPIFADDFRRHLAGRPLRYEVDRRRGYRRIRAAPDRCNPLPHGGCGARPQ